MKAIFSVFKRNIASSLAALIVTVLVMALATTSGDSAIALSRGNFAWLYILALPFFVVFFNFRRLAYLNASKRDYYLGSLFTYAVAAIAVSGVNTLIHLLIDPLNRTQTVVNLMELSTWTKNGLPVAFLQQAVFLLLAAVFLHVLLSMQERWYGWAADVVLIAVICVFTPIAPLRGVLVGFFGLIMFNENALLHIGICLGGSLALALGGMAVLKRKTL